MIQFNSGSLRVTILALTKLGTSERVAAKAAVFASGKELRKAIEQNISLQDHTLSQLAALGHPYARRQGSIAIHRTGSNNLVNPEFRVHTQSGTLKNALRDARGSGPMPRHRVWLDVGLAPHAAYVVMGTRVMLPRDVLWSTADSKAVKTKMLKGIVKKLGKSMRTGATLRAGGV